MLLERLVHWFKEQVACQHAGDSVKSGQAKLINPSYVEAVQAVANLDIKI